MALHLDTKVYYIKKEQQKWQFQPPWVSEDSYSSKRGCEVGCLARVEWRENRTCTLASIICITMGPDFVLIFILSTAHCVTIIMCAAENSEMVMPWIQSNADSWNGSYFNFLHSMNIIYFDMCKWGFIHYKKLSTWIWGCSTAAVILLKFTRQKKEKKNCSRAQILVKGVFVFTFWLLQSKETCQDRICFLWIIIFSFNMFDLVEV